MRTFAAVIFDIDGTLAPVVSWTDFTKRLGASPEAHLKIYEDYRAGRITYLESKVCLLGLWRSTGNANHAYIERAFADMPLNPQALPLIHWAQQHARLCLISGSIDVFVLQVARATGIRDFFANTRFIFDADDNLVDYDYVLDQSGKKLRQLQEFCTRYDVGPKQCAVVGDSENDIELFKTTGNGILIGNNPALKPYAWRTARSLKDARRILATHV
jgi:HAD superfamily phosphoserine phosphatase-like hydrolase